MNDRPRKDGLLSLNRILDGALSECGLDERLAERNLLTEWTDLVGERLAEHVRAVDLRETVLFLDADHGAWRQEITLMLPEIQRRCDQRFGPGTVTDIRWIRPGTR